MKVSVQRKDLSRVLSLASRAVPSSSTLPILGCYHLSTKGDDELVLRASNLETSITVWVPAQVRVAGTAAPPAKVFSDLIGSLAGDSIELVEDKHAVAVSCGANRSRVRGLNPDDWPQPPAEPEQADLGIEASVLKTALDQVAPAVAKDDTRPALAGVLFKCEREILALAAADGYRLATSRINTAESISGNEVNAIVPLRAVGELLRLLDQDEVQLSIIPEQAVVFRGPGWVLTSRLIAGTFPNYQQIIPQRHTTRAIVEREALMRAIRAVRVVSARADAALNDCIKATVNEGQLTLSANAADVGQVEESMIVEREGGPMDFAICGRYLLDALSVLPTERAVLELLSPSSPIVVKPPDDTSYLAVVMPITLRQGA